MVNCWEADKQSAGGLPTFFGGVSEIPFHPNCSFDPQRCMASGIGQNEVN